VLCFAWLGRAVFFTVVENDLSFIFLVSCSLFGLAGMYAIFFLLEPTAAKTPSDSDRDVVEQVTAASV
jgi:hypothetical protein